MTAQDCELFAPPNSQSLAVKEFYLVPRAMCPSTFLTWPRAVAYFQTK